MSGSILSFIEPNSPLGFLFFLFSSPVLRRRLQHTTLSLLFSIHLSPLSSLHPLCQRAVITNLPCSRPLFPFAYRHRPATTFFLCVPLSIQQQHALSLSHELFPIICESISFFIASACWPSSAIGCGDARVMDAIFSTPDNVASWHYFFILHRRVSHAAARTRPSPPYWRSFMHSLRRVGASEHVLSHFFAAVFG